MPDDVLVGVEFGDEALGVFDVEDVAIGKDGYFGAAVVGPTPKDAAGRPGDGEDFGTGAVVGDHEATGFEGDWFELAVEEV